MKRILGFALFLVLLYAVPAGACTTFAVMHPDGQGVMAVAKSYDWGSQAGLVVANMTGIHKVALSVPTDNAAVPLKPLRWTSKYNSITFNQYGREMPNGGMNQFGLVVEETEMDPGANYISGEDYIPAGATMTTNGNQWEQYILDSFSSVDDFLDPKNFPPAFAIVPNFVPIHLLVCDTSRCAVVEIIDNNFVVTEDEDVPGPADQSYVKQDFATASLSFTDLNTGEQIVGPVVPIYALANDYYQCSVYGGVNEPSGNNTLALTDYQYFGGSRQIQDHVSSGGFCENLPVVDGTQTWCDYACRSSKSSWSTSNSVERFVRAAYWDIIIPAYGWNYVALDSALRNVYSMDTTTGGTKWQIIYDPNNLRVFWKTDCDNYDPTGEDLTGDYHTLAFSDVNFGDGSCATHDAEVVNMDALSTCPGNVPGVGNPIPDLPSCPVGSHSPFPVCTMSDYNSFESSYSCYDNLVYDSAYSCQVSFAATKTLSNNIAIYEKMATDFYPAITGDQLKEVMYNIWGGFPDGFTACGRDVTPADVANLFLSSAKDPLIVPTMQNKLDNTDYQDNITYNAPYVCTYDVTLNFSDFGTVSVNNLSVATDGTFTISGKNSGVNGEVTVVCPLTPNSPLKLYPKFDAVWSVDMPGLLFQNQIPPICFESDAKPTLSLTFENNTCKNNCVGLAEPICEKICNEVVNDYAEPKAKERIQSMLDDTVKDELPVCGATTVAAPAPPPTLTAGWGDLEGQYVTARAGHTYNLEGIVNADRDSLTHEFAIFSQAVPGTTAPVQMDAIRMRALTGDNSVDTLWTPGSPGDYDLFFDVYRWDGPIDKFPPAVLQVHVLPPEGPTSWLGLTNEGLSSKLKEVK